MAQNLIKDVALTFTRKRRDRSFQQILDLYRPGLGVKILNRGFVAKGYQLYLNSVVCAISAGKQLHPIFLF